MKTTPTDPIVETKINGVWTDITADVRLSSAASGGGISIARGRSNEAPKVEPTSIGFTLNNGVSKVAGTLGQSGVYSAENVVGPYYGLLGRNQPVRVGIQRRRDDFNHVEVDGMGWLPQVTLTDGTLESLERWRLTGTAANFDITGGQATIAGSVGNKIATFGDFSDADVLIKFKTSVRDSEIGLMLRKNDPFLTPPAGFDAFANSGGGGWAANGTSTSAWDTTTFHEGIGSIKMAVAGSPVSPVVSQVAPGYSVTPGDTHRFRAWYRSSILGSARITFSYYDINSVFIIAYTQDTAAVPANTWTRVEVTPAGTAPPEAAFVRVGVGMTGSPANGTFVWADEAELFSYGNQYWYSLYITPGGTDQIRIGKVAPGVVRSRVTNLATNLVAGSFYWMRGQVNAGYIRGKIWLDGTTEPDSWNIVYYDDVTVSETPMPLSGGVGLISNGGTSLYTVESIEVNQWRGHAEIAELPNRWDISRRDRWVPITAKGILRRLGQGRKSLRSAMTLHLQSYASLSYGWWPVETDTGDSAGNMITNGTPGVLNTISFAAPDLTGNAALPGVEGFATLTADTSSMSFQIQNHANTTGAETVLFAFRIPNVLGSEHIVATMLSTGTVRNWQIRLSNVGGLRVLGFDRTSVILVDQTFASYGISDLPQGCWIIGTMLVKTNGVGVDWTFNYHRPGSASFWTNNGNLATAQIGIFNSIFFRGSSQATAAGNVSIAQVMHYAGDLPFVSSAFERASSAYSGERADVRFTRLCINAGINGTTLTSANIVPQLMGFQLPNKVLDLLQECAETDDGIISEDRDDFALLFIASAVLFNRIPYPMDVDLGHLSLPLEPNSDDQGTRNDVTATRNSGGFYRATALTGPLNVNDPELDPLGVGVYDSAPSYSAATDAQMKTTAWWEVSKGTQPQSRYPSMHADLSSTLYRETRREASRVLALDAGHAILLKNPEVTFDTQTQQVQAYTETLDQYTHDLVFTAIPSPVFTVGVVNYTTRVDSVTNQVQASFIAGTDTRLKSTKNAAGGLAFVSLAQSAISFPFDIMVHGVRLRVTSVGDNLTTDGGFAAGTTTAWLATSANVTLLPSLYDPKLGPRCMQVKAVAAGTDGIVQAAANNSTTIAATDYLACGWVKTEIAATALRITADFYQADGTTFISTPAPTTITTVAGAWTFYSAVITSPALGVRARIKVTNVFGAAGSMWVDDLKLIPTSTYLSDPQTLVVEQAPINGASKTIPAGKIIRLADPWKVGR